ncbi:MAG: hypothetical protein ACTHJQ_22690 [Rhizobiaceae bacterium]
MGTEDDTETGGDALSVEQAASAFVKANAKEPEGQLEQDAEQGEEADDELQDSDLDESDEAEGDPDEEGQADDEDGEEQGSDQGRFVASNGKVKLPDGTVLTVADLIQGNLRDRDYRQKTMQASEERRILEQQSSALKASEQQVKQKIEYVDQLLKAFTPQPPDPSLLDQNSQSYDPFGYMAAKDQYDRMMGVHNYVQQQMTQSQQQAQQQTARERNDKAAKEWETLQDKLPELRTPAKAEAFATSLAKTGSAYGFTQEELVGALPYDHRFALVLRDAERWRKLQANKPKAIQQVQGRPPVQKSGKRLTPDAQKARRAEDAIKRLKQSGSVEDATAAYLASRKG